MTFFGFNKDVHYTVLLRDTLTKFVSLYDPFETLKTLKTLFARETDDGNKFVKRIQNYNGCFQMTSVGTNNKVKDLNGFN